MQAPQTLDQFFERPRPRAFSNRVVLICGLMAAIEAMDVYVLGVLLPPLARHFGVTLAQFAVVFTFQAIGQIVGTYAVAPLADRFGRRPVILLCTFAFGILTLGSAFSPDLWAFILQRAVAFVFIGGALPNIFAMASEYAAGQMRSRNALIIGSFHGIGAGMAALAGGFLVPYGWQVPLIVCGGLTLLSAVLAYAYVPESLRFLAACPTRSGKLRRVVARIDPDVREAQLEPSSVREGGASRMRLAELFTADLRKSTILLWVIGTVTLSLLSSIAQWLPTYIHSYSGISLKQAAYMTSVNGPAGVIWPLVLIWLLRRLGTAAGMAHSWVGQPAVFMLCAIRSIRRACVPPAPAMP